jgi:hypothetical protein
MQDRTVPDQRNLLHRTAGPYIWVTRVSRPRHRGKGRAVGNSIRHAGASLHCIDLRRLGASRCRVHYWYALATSMPVRQRNGGGKHTARIETTFQRSQPSAVAASVSGLFSIIVIEIDIATI